jgi:hypothetical protein
MEFNSAFKGFIYIVLLRKQNMFHSPNEGEIVIVFILISTFLVRRWRDKESWVIWVRNLRVLLSFQNDWTLPHFSKDLLSTRMYNLYFDRANTDNVYSCTTGQRNPKDDSAAWTWSVSYLSDYLVWEHQMFHCWGGMRLLSWNSGLQWIRYPLSEWQMI